MNRCKPAGQAGCDPLPSAQSPRDLSRAGSIELLGKASSWTLTADDLAFLNQGSWSGRCHGAATELTAQQVIAARLDEIDRALDAGAPLAVIFLVGSTLEGLLAELSLAHASTFASAAAAPKVEGSVKSLDTWTLFELITVSHALGLLGEDVAKHADQVRNFRNYIHPRQQLKENFEPRIETARFAQQVFVQLWRTFSRSFKRGERNR